MSRRHGWLLAGALLLGFALLLDLMSASAQAQTGTRVRGTITGFDGHVLEIKTRDGNDIKLNLADNVSISSLTELHMSDIKQGGFVGVTASKMNPEGKQYALEVHVFPEASRGSGEGHRDWDLAPGSTMTNATIDAIVERNDGKELTLSYKGGMQKIIVPPDTPVVSFVPGDTSLLKAGAHIFAMTQQADNGSLTVRRMLVGTASMKPPM